MGMEWAGLFLLTGCQLKYYTKKRYIRINVYIDHWGMNMTDSDSRFKPFRLLGRATLLKRSRLAAAGSAKLARQPVAREVAP